MRKQKRKRKTENKNQVHIFFILLWFSFTYKYVKIGISKRSRSELDLIDIAKSGKQKDGIKHRAQNILTVIPRFGRRSSLPHPETSVSTPAFPKGGNSP